MILHPRKYTSIESLVKVKPVKPANVGELWMNISHHDVITTLLNEAKGLSMLRHGNKLDLTPYQIVLRGNKSEMAACFLATSKNMVDRLQIGITHSTNNRRSITLYGGLEFTDGVRGDMESCVVAKYSLPPKREGSFNLKFELEAGLRLIAGITADPAGLLRDARMRSMTQAEARLMAMEIMEQKLVPPSQMPQLLAHMTRTDHGIAGTSVNVRDLLLKACDVIRRGVAGVPVLERQWQTYKIAMSWVTQTNAQKKKLSAV